MEFGGESKRRYSRQVAVEDIGTVGQEKICRSSVLVIGCGALGSMVAMQLAGAGVGNIGIADFDTIDISNLQRQLFFKTDEAGKYKAVILGERIRELNPDCVVNVISEMIGKRNAHDVFANYDYVVDATDNAPSKMLVEETCAAMRKPYCVAGVTGFHGQVFSSNHGDTRFGDIFPVENDSEFLPCSIAGVLGPAAALCASLQSAAVIKQIVGITSHDSSELIVFDLRSNSFHCYEI